MKVHLISFSGSKLDAVKCVRNLPGMNLLLAKNIVEGLPCEVVAPPDQVDALRRCFELQVSDGSNTTKWFAMWNALPRDRQALLLQYLMDMGMLRYGEDE